MVVGSLSHSQVNLIRRQRVVVLAVLGLEIRLNSWEIWFDLGHGKVRNLKLTSFSVLTGTALF